MASKKDNPPGSVATTTRSDDTPRSDSSPSVQLPGGPIPVHSFRPVHPAFIGNEYKDSLRVGDRFASGGGNFTIERMLHDPSNVAGALFCFCRFTSEDESHLKFLLFPSGAVAWLE